jgi:hypothetical protein
MTNAMADACRIRNGAMASALPAQRQRRASANGKPMHSNSYIKEDGKEEKMIREDISSVRTTRQSCAPSANTSARRGVPRETTGVAP